MARYLVTGGAGFIGSHLVQALLSRGDDVRVLDDFSTGRRENLGQAADWARAGGAAFELVEGDIRDPQACHDATRGVAYVLHQAALSSVPRSVHDPLLTHRVNLDGTLHLLEAARAAGVERFVYASSSSVYGESAVLPKVESMPPAPISPYALQKLGAESYCRLYHRLYGLPTIALRYFNVFGPRQDPASEYAAVIPRFIRALRQGEPPTIYGDGEQTRDFTFVSNVVEANLLACRAGEAAWGRAYNIAMGERISLNALLGLLRELCGASVEARHVAPRPGDVRDSLAGVDEARRLLDYRPSVALRAGLEKTVRAF